MDKRYKKPLQALDLWRNYCISKQKTLSQPKRTDMSLFAGAE